MASIKINSLIVELDQLEKQAKETESALGSLVAVYQEIGKQGGMKELSIRDTIVENIKLIADYKLQITELKALISGGGLSPIDTVVTRARSDHQTRMNEILAEVKLQESLTAAKRATSAADKVSGGANPNGSITMQPGTSTPPVSSAQQRLLITQGKASPDNTPALPGTAFIGEFDQMRIQIANEKAKQIESQKTLVSLDKQMMQEMGLTLAPSIEEKKLKRIEFEKRLAELDQKMMQEMGLTRYTETPKMHEALRGERLQEALKATDERMMKEMNLTPVGQISEFQKKLSTLSAEMQKGLTGFIGNRKVTDMETSPMVKGVQELSLQLEGTTTPLKVFVSALGNAARSLEALAIADQKTAAQNQLRTDPRFNQLNKLAGKYGFTQEDLQTMQGGGHPIERVNRQTGIIEQVPSRMEATYSRDVDGVTQRQKFMVDSSGRAITETSRKFRDFTESMRTNLAEMAKWTLAVGLIYGPMRKLSELYQIMVENESKLADVSVIVNENFQSQKTTFDSVAKSALKYGEELSGVISAYGQAYKAVGSRTTPQTRGEDATALLEASLALSKLSNMDEGQAIDILTAALAQTNTEFKNSTDIIDKWVRVAREAKVDVSDLATGTAMLGDAAETAGLDIDQLNALISAMSQVTIAGPKEASNTLKMLMSNISADRTELALNKIGMSAKNTRGEVKGLWEILMDIVSANKAGLLSETELNKLGADILGPRQGKNLVSLVQRPEILMQALDTSKNGIGGETEEAMAKKMDTVKTSTINMANAFGMLAQSLGTSGGILDSTANLLELFTKLVLKLDEATQFFGKATPALMAFGVAALALKGKTGGIGNWVEVELVRRKIGAQKTDPWAGTGLDLQDPNRGTAGRGFAYGAGQFAQKYAGAAAVTTGIALSNAMSGDKEAAVGALIGGAAGAALGGLAGPVGATIGASVGATAASAFIGSITKDVTLAAYFESLANQDKKDSAGKGTDTKGTDAEIALESLFKNVSKKSAFGEKNPTVDQGMILSNLAATLQNFNNRIDNTLKGTKLPTDLTASDMARLYGPKQDVKTLENAYRQNEAQKQIDNVAASPFDTSVKKLKDDNAELISRLSLDTSKNLRDKLNAQEISAPEYGRSIDALGGLGNLGTSGIQAFGEELKRLNPEIRSTEDQYKAFLKILTEGNPEQLGFISASISDIEILTIQLAAATSEAEKLRISLALKDAQTNIATYTTAAIEGIDNPTPSDFQVQRFPDTSYPGAGVLQSLMDKELAFMTTNFPKWEPNIEEFGVTMKGNVTEILHGDMRLLNLAMGKLIDVNQKQLDGLYNMPEGANFMIPIGAARMVHDTLEAGQGSGLETPTGTGLNEKVRPNPVPRGNYWSGVSPYPPETTGVPVRTPTPPALPITSISIDEQMLSISANELSTLQQILSAINSGFASAAFGSLGPSSVTGGLGESQSLLPETGSPQVLEGFFNWLQNLMPSAGGIGVGAGLGIGPNGANTNLFAQPENAQPLPNVSRFDIKFESTTQLIVDGRTLAEVVKPYLAEDMANTNDSQGTITRNYVI